MEEKIQNKKNVFTLEAKLASALFIKCEPIEAGTNRKLFNIDISDSTKAYDVMGYTTDIDTMQLIFQNRTIRSSSLTNANLNDPDEKKRVGVDQFASSRFITCFCHDKQESPSFWRNYGKVIKENKVLLQFSNFANNFTEYIKTDFAKVKDNKLAFFKRPEYGNTINSHNETNTSLYDLRACISSISFFDVEYVPLDSPVFTKNYAGHTNVDFSPR